LEELEVTQFSLFPARSDFICLIAGWKVKKYDYIPFCALVIQMNYSDARKPQELSQNCVLQDLAFSDWLCKCLELEAMCTLDIYFFLLDKRHLIHVGINTANYFVLSK